MFETLLENLLPSQALEPLIFLSLELQAELLSRQTEIDPLGSISQSPLVVYTNVPKPSLPHVLTDSHSLLISLKGSGLLSSP